MCGEENSQPRKEGQSPAGFGSRKSNPGGAAKGEKIKTSGGGWFEGKRFFRVRVFCVFFLKKCKITPLYASVGNYYL